MALLIGIAVWLGVDLAFGAIMYIVGRIMAPELGLHPPHYWACFWVSFWVTSFIALLYGVHELLD